MKKEKKNNNQLINASDEYCFWTNDNRALRNLEDLVQALKEMNDDVFCHHANKEKNDFANWIKDVLKDIELARAVKRLKTRQTMIKKIENRLKEAK
ncbi:hypothetical protein L6248_00515 [Candidatus Parcubacteria bacterium]|nr:hypothetical protein [Candidatus Parcubacteria bacterium]